MGVLYLMTSEAQLGCGTFLVSIIFPVEVSVFCDSLLCISPILLMNIRNPMDHQCTSVCMSQPPHFTVKRTADIDALRKDVSAGISLSSNHVSADKGQKSTGPCVNGCYCRVSSEYWVVRADWLL